MLLAVDIGNTNIVYGLFDGTSLVRRFRVESNRSRTSDEYAVGLHQLFAMQRLEPCAVTAAIVASVVPTLTEPIVQVVRQVLSIEPTVIGLGTRTGMPILYDNPHEVGADRIADAVAAYERVKAAVIVVDFGTATTFNCVSPKGEYVGGVICPGIHISADALFARAARLPRVEVAVPPRIVGRNTVHSIQSGIVWGYVSMVDGLIQKIRAELGFSCAAIATGGLSRVLAPLSSEITEYDEDLTLIGLRMLHERNPTLVGSRS